MTVAGFSRGCELRAYAAATPSPPIVEQILYELVEHEHSGLVDELLLKPINFAGDILTAADQRWLFRAWIVAQFFSSLHPTKPILLMCGEKGNGKTSAVRKVLKVFFGKDTDVTALDATKPDGFIATVTTRP